MKTVIIYTDGGCKQNPGPGGWAALLIYGKHERVLTGAARRTTNNKMELTAALEALRALKMPCHVRLHTDSTYLMNAFARNWLDKWQSNGWMTTARNPVKNKDLWQALLDESRRHTVTWIKVKAHANNKHNNRVDRLATKARKALQRKAKRRS